MFACCSSKKILSSVIPPVLINNKPNLLFKFQIIKQNYEYDILTYGVLITRIHKLSVLNTINIKEGDYLLEVNNNKISKEGNLKFNFYYPIKRTC
jgi:hypothetical protein